MTDIVHVRCLTGESSNKEGATRFHVGLISADGETLVVRDLHRAWRGVKDRVTSEVPASSAGSVAGQILGRWQTRDMEMPDGTMFMTRYEVKSAGEILYKAVRLPFICDKNAPLIEIRYPVVQDQFSTQQYVYLQGRVRLPVSLQEFFEHRNYAQGAASYPFRKSIDDVYPELADHWDSLKVHMRHSDDWFKFISAKGTRDDYLVEVRKIAPGVIIREAHTRKTVTSKEGKKISIARKKRRIKI